MSLASPQWRSGCCLQIRGSEKVIGHYRVLLARANIWISEMRRSLNSRGLRVGEDLYAVPGDLIIGGDLYLWAQAGLRPSR